MLSTKLWFVIQVAMAITARPIMDASKTRHPSCSRMGIRILTIVLRNPDGWQVFSLYGGRRAADGQAAEARGGAMVSQHTLLASGR